MPDGSIDTTLKQNPLWRKAIIATVIILVLLYTKLAVAEKERPAIKLWTRSSEYRIKAEMSVPRPHKSVFHILIDYESIDDHINLFKVSRVLERNDNIIHLYQVNGLEVLFFVIESETYLVVQEIPYKKITFQKEKGDFKVHQGSWTLVPAKGDRSTLIRYEVQAIPDFYVPEWLVMYFMEKEVRKALKELYRWIMNETKSLGDAASQ